MHKTNTPHPHTHTHQLLLPHLTIFLHPPSLLHHFLSPSLYPPPLPSTHGPHLQLPTLPLITLSTNLTPSHSFSQTTPSSPVLYLHLILTPSLPSLYARLHPITHLHLFMTNISAFLGKHCTSEGHWKCTRSAAIPAFWHYNMNMDTHTWKLETAQVLIEQELWQHPTPLT